MMLTLNYLEYSVFLENLKEVGYFEIFWYEVYNNIFTYSMPRLFEANFW